MMHRVVFCLLSALVLQGCADLGIDNPFSSGTSDVSEVYYDQFTDIPIPRDLSVDRSRSLVSVTRDGAKVGLVTAQGRVEMLSLTSAMVRNMSGQGWTLRSSTTGPKMMQVYEKDSRYTVLYYYEQAMSTAMEIWVGTRLSEGTVPEFSTGGSYAAPPTGGDPLYDDPGFGTSQPLSQ